VGQLAADQVVLAAVDLGPLHAARLHRLRYVAGEGVERFVIVVVAVEGEVRKSGHRLSWSRRPESSEHARDRDEV